MANRYDETQLTGNIKSTSIPENIDNLIQYFFGTFFYKPLTLRLKGHPSSRSKGGSHA